MVPGTFVTFSQWREMTVVFPIPNVFCEDVMRRLMGIVYNESHRVTVGNGMTPLDKDLSHENHGVHDSRPLPFYDSTRSHSQPYSACWHNLGSGTLCALYRLMLESGGHHQSPKIMGGKTVTSGDVFRLSGVSRS